MWGACVKEIFRLDKTFSDLDFKTRFEISNKFKRILRHRSFEHYAHLIPYNLHSFFFQFAIDRPCGPNANALIAKSQKYAKNIENLNAF